MKKLPLILLLVSFNSYADNWNTDDTIRELTFTIPTIIDWSQTRYVAANPNKYYETNKIIGKHPSDVDVNRYFAAYLTEHFIVSYLLPETPRKIWQYSTAIYEVSLVNHNFKIGVEMKF